MGQLMYDKDDCAVYAVAFVCHVDPDRSRYVLGQCGRAFRDGATDVQIRAACRLLGRRLRRFRSECRTVRTFARDNVWGTFLVTTADHVVAVVDGNVCDRSWRADTSDLMRIVRVDKVSRI